MVNANQDSADAAYPDWKPTDWTTRQRVRALISLLCLSVACAMIAWSLTIWGTNSQALNTFVPLGCTLLLLSATLLTSVYWYAYRHALNSTGDGPEAISVLLVVIGLIALVTIVLQALGGILVATIGWDGWRVYSGGSYWGPGALGGFAIFLLAATSNLKWSPTRNPALPQYRLSSQVTGVRLLLRWGEMLLARNSWVLIWGALAFDVAVSNQLDNGMSVDLTAPMTIFWCLAALFFALAVVELFPGQTQQNMNQQVGI